jgi:hypothetical protein
MREACVSVIHAPISTVQRPVLRQHSMKGNGIPQLQNQSREQTTFETTVPVQIQR